MIRRIQPERDPPRPVAHFVHETVYLLRIERTAPFHILLKFFDTHMVSFFQIAPAHFRPHPTVPSPHEYRMLLRRSLTGTPTGRRYLPSPFPSHLPRSAPFPSPHGRRTNSTRQPPTVRLQGQRDGNFSHTTQQIEHLFTGSHAIHPAQPGKVPRIGIVIDNERIPLIQNQSPGPVVVCRSLRGSDMPSEPTFSMSP